MHRAVAWSARMNTGAGHLVPHPLLQAIVANVGGWQEFERRFPPEQLGRPRWIDFGSEGMSDFLGCLRPAGRMLALEIKRPGYSPSAVTQSQREFLEQVAGAGGLALVASDLQRIDAVLSGAELEDSGHGYRV
ncbi:MAG: hypothetical protein ACREVZ_14175 [Burkholderiales bacterium]